MTLTRTIFATVLAALAAVLTAGAAAPAAPLHLTFAPNDPQESSNWAGYAVARTDATSGAPTSFHAVSGSWTEPTARCSGAEKSYSAFWIGLGGASEGSKALEQVGTSADCDGGKPSYYVWYESVPAPSVKTTLKISPGDKMHAVVAVNGTTVILRIQNLTRRTVFTKTLHVSVTDVTSAEWIAEAPSACTSSGRCRVLPLADFGKVDFTSGLAVTTDGRTGAIASSEWDATPIRLVPDQTAANGKVAVPTALTADGTGFSVSAQTAG
jgi:Peptidase A4 family